MNELLTKYMEEVNFEEIDYQRLTFEKINSLENKEGLIVLTDTTNLWISRGLSVHNILGIATVMESASTFSIMDDFGMTVWSGDPESIIDFIEGFIE